MGKHNSFSFIKASHLDSENIDELVLAAGGSRFLMGAAWQALAAAANGGARRHQALMAGWELRQAPQGIQLGEGLTPCFVLCIVA